MVDGEVMERLWSYLRLFRKMTKEMTASHREDILSDVRCFVFLCKETKIKNWYIYTVHAQCIFSANELLISFYVHIYIIYTFYLSNIVMLLNAQMQRCTELLSHSTSEIEELRENSPGKYTEQCMCGTGICLQNFLIICYRAIKQVYSTGI